MTAAHDAVSPITWGVELLRNETDDNLLRTLSSFGVAEECEKVTANFRELAALCLTVLTVTVLYGKG